MIVRICITNSHSHTRPRLLCCTICINRNNGSPWITPIWICLQDELSFPRSLILIHHLFVFLVAKFKLFSPALTDSGSACGLAIGVAFTLLPGSELDAQGRHGFHREHSSLVGR